MRRNTTAQRKKEAAHTPTGRGAAIFMAGQVEHYKPLKTNTMPSTKQTLYDIDRWDETSLTWSPVAHSRDAFEALDTRDKLAETHPDARFRVRNKETGTCTEREPAGQK